jgi:hypothetical protein
MKNRCIITRFAYKGDIIQRISSQTVKFYYKCYTFEGFISFIYHILSYMFQKQSKV